MVQYRRVVTTVVIMGISLLAGTLVRSRHSGSSFSAAAAEATPNDSTYDLFLAVPATAGDTALGKRLLRRASQLNADGKYTLAISTYDKAAAQLPQIADWINVFAAGSAAHLGDTAQVKRRLSAVDDALGDEWAWRTRSVAYEEAGARARAVAAAMAGTKSGSAAKRAAAWYRVAELQHDADNEAARKAALLSAIRASAESEASADAARELAGFKDLSVAERHAVGRALMRNGEISSGVRLLEPLLDDGQLDAAAQAGLRYELARVLFSVRRYADAETQLLRIPATSERAPDARFLLARVYQRQGKDDEGKRTLESVFEKYPKSRAATQALFLLADLNHDDGRVDDALALFERAAAAPTRSEAAAEAMMRSGAIAFVRGDFARAVATFDTFRTRYTTGLYHHQAMYWAALSRMRIGKNTEARALLADLRKDSPLSYYGVRAADLLGKSPLDITLASAPETPPATVRAIANGMARWQLLNDVEWNSAASFELGRLRARFAGERAALYEIAEQLQKRGAPHLGMVIGRALLDDTTQWNARLLRILYPMPFKKLIVQHAAARGLDPYFVAAVIRQESRFNANAMSGAGAVGLMQVLPSTGRQIGRRTTKGRVTAARLTEPQLNLQLGTKFLSDLMDTYNERVDIALVAYNAGPTRADRWRNFPEFASEDLFVERVPFDETREYIKAIKTNMAVYRALYGTDQSAD